MEADMEVIVLSDDSETELEASVLLINSEQTQDKQRESELDASVVMIAEQTQDKQHEQPETNEVLDDDMTITFSKGANVLPHARFDCTLPFSIKESDEFEPDSSNLKYCEQCFCYVCDQLASNCKFWAVPGNCHCNAHKRSVHWKSLRDKRIMGYLHVLGFSFSPADMDSELRCAETALQDFACSLGFKSRDFLVLLGEQNRPPCTHCHARNNKTGAHPSNRSTAGCSQCYNELQQQLQDQYKPVKEHVSAFLSQAMKENSKTCAVMLLGAIKLFIPHSACGRVHSAPVSCAVLELFTRATVCLQTLMVSADFPASFTKHLQDFFQTLPLPLDSRTSTSSINVFAWDDPLLAAVLKGQNVTGVRRVRGKPVALHETLVVIRARVCQLQQQERYRELARYLKVVKTDLVPELQVLKDNIPYYLCKVGDYSGAVNAMFNATPGSLTTATKLSSFQFGVYLKIFMTGNAPLEPPCGQNVDSGSHLRSLLQRDKFQISTWAPIECGDLLRIQEVLKFALRIMNSNLDVYKDSESWEMILHYFNLSSNGSALKEPSQDFLMRSRDHIVGILSELSKTFRVQIPASFLHEFPNQALLLLATQALVWRILNSRLRPILNIVLTFKSNPWAAAWFLQSLMGQSLKVAQDFFCIIIEELLLQKCYLRKHHQTVQCFIAHFLALFFLDPRFELYFNTYPINELLAKWNELQNPWQCKLKLQLKHNDFLLSEDKRQILNLMLQGSSVSGTWS